MRLLAVVALAVSAVACSVPMPPPAPEETGPRAGAATGPRAASASAGQTVAGVVAETMDSGGYTYARLTGVANGGEQWIAAAAFPVATGASITAVVDMPMSAFRSRTLDREFASIYFVRDVTMNGTPVTPGRAAASLAPAAGEAPGAPALMGSHGATAAALPATPALVEPVAPLPGGVSIADVWATRAARAGQAVVVRGRVVKANLGILGANWYHLQDGSGEVAAGTHDLVVTSAAALTVGEVVTATGVLGTNRDFGAGYTYAAIVERAEIRR